MSDRIRALVGCQNPRCAAEVSYHLDMVRKFEGQPVCQNCFEETYAKTDEDGVPLVDWHDLPQIDLKDLCE